MINVISFSPVSAARIHALIGPDLLDRRGKGGWSGGCGCGRVVKPGRAAEVVLLDEVDAFEEAVAVVAAGAGVGGRASRTSLSFMGEYSRPRDEPASALKLDAHPLVRDWLACVYV